MATGGDSPQGSLQIENFECSICLEVYMRPKVLSCGHTFCMECLVSLVRGSKSLKCPTCQKSIKLTKGGRAGVETLIGVISLANLRDDVKTSTGRQGRGPQGAENPAVVSDESMCPEHRGEELRFYCPPCDAVICEECMLEDHNTHGVTRLGRTLQQQTAKAREASEQGKRLMKQVRDKITGLEKSKRSLAVEESTQIKAVDETAQKLTSDFASEVIKRANALKDDLRNFFANNMILDRQERLETQLAQLESSTEALERSVNQEKTIAVFRSRKELVELSSQATKEESDVEAEWHTTAVFTPTPYNLPEVHLGKVEAKARPQMSKKKSKGTREVKESVEAVSVSLTDEAEVNDEEVVEIKDKTGLKYKYREDQWSPLNPEGKKQYDRSFLLQFQPECMVKPDGLPKIVDVVLDKPLIITPQQMQGRPQDFRGMGGFNKGGPPGIPDLMPSYMKSPGGGHERKYCRSSGSTMNQTQPIQTSAEDTVPKQTVTSTGPRYSAPQTVTSAPPPQMFWHPDQMIPGHVPQQAYPQPTLFIPQQYRPHAYPHFQPPQPITQGATANHMQVAGGTQTTYRTDDWLQQCRQYFPISRKPESLPMDRIQDELERLLIKDTADNEKIFDWIEKNVDKDRTKGPTFIRALMTAVCRSAIIGHGSYLRCDTQGIQKRVVLLQKYLDNESTRELQALFALQALMVQLDQPPNLLRMFFDTLYDEDVISEDAFYAWESNTDPAEQEGKRVALKSVTAFFTWLREAEEEQMNS